MLRINMDTINTDIIRGGSSKGLFLSVNDLPSAGEERNAIILRLMGSPDLRQIDGLGGADKLTSKVALIGPPSRSDCDISYHFGQVGTDKPTIDWSSNCGNISAGAALYAAYKGVGKYHDSDRLINIEQVNTGRILKARVPMNGTIPAKNGDYVIGGAPGSGPRIDLDFCDFAGSCFGGGLFPTGCSRDYFYIPSLGNIEITILDMANFHIFVRAKDLKLININSVLELQNDKKLISVLEDIRKTVSIELGFVDLEHAERYLQISMNPLVHIIDLPSKIQLLNGKFLYPENMDLIGLSFSRGIFSKAFPGTGAVGTAVACSIIGTIPSELQQSKNFGSGIMDWVICHPGGLLTVTTELVNNGGVIAI
ncbi:hypothetical protein C5470_01270 [Photorhabdus stackebrandtii]|uniref:3-methylitaconate isomerase n=2 Tax=Photorhabdus stackebrandtii TaxID=1123042 RepID=A0A7X5QIY7_9GAMM|nr:hypothetical protein [Photorhabdus stackebrandtii]